MAESEVKEMSFSGTFRRATMAFSAKFLFAIVIVAVAVFIFQKDIYENFLLAHRDPNFLTYRAFCNFFSAFGVESGFCNVEFSGDLQSLKVTQQFMNSIWTSLILGLIVAFPYVFMGSLAIYCSWPS